MCQSSKEHLDLIHHQQEAIKSLKMMMKTLIKRNDKKKNSRRSKKKRSRTPSESSESDDPEYRKVCLEPRKKSNSYKSISQRMNELEHLEAAANRA